MLVSKFLLTLSNCPDGLIGSGKTMSLCHTVHFCYTQGWLVLHIPDGETKKKKSLLPGCWLLALQNYKKCLQPYNLFLFIFSPNNTAHLWMKNCKELLPSAYNSSRFDQPLQATDWLRNFKSTNERFLSKVMMPFYKNISHKAIFMWTASLQFSLNYWNGLTKA